MERRIATSIENEQERGRIIALRAHELFCSRGCEHGFDLDDWLAAEEELSPEADDVVLTQVPSGFKISIAERMAQASIVLSMASSSILILWTSNEPHAPELGPMRHSTLNLLSLSDAVDLEKADVTYEDDRVCLYLPYAEREGLPSEGVGAESDHGEAMQRTKPRGSSAKSGR